MSDTVNVAIVGVGNCASALVQGVHKYRDASPDEFVPGLMHVDLGGYHVRDIEFVAAFDVDARKVGHDLSEAVFAEPNNTIRFADVPHLGVTVSRGLTLDGIGKYLSEVVDQGPGDEVDVAGILRDTSADVLVNYLPVGSEQATRWYMEQALAAGCALVNCIPVFIAPRGRLAASASKSTACRSSATTSRARSAPRSSTAMLARLFARPRRAAGAHQPAQRRRQHRLPQHARARAPRVEEDLQDDQRHQPARGASSTPEDIHVGPSDYVPWLTDRKWAHIRLEGARSATCRSTSS